MSEQESEQMIRLDMIVELAGKSTTFLIMELSAMRQTHPMAWDRDDVILYNLIQNELNSRN